MLPNLAELQTKCLELGLNVTQKGKRPAKDDYVQALRAHYMQADYPNGLPYEELTPMLCFQEWELKDTERQSIWNSPNWVAQQKLNGCRVILHFIKGVGVFAHSRTISVKTYRFQELTKTLLFRDLIPTFTATLDTEAIIEKPIDTRKYTGGKGEVTKTSLHSVTAVLHLDPENGRKLQEEQQAPIIFKVLDLLKLGYEPATVLNLKEKPLQERMSYYGALEDMLEEVKINQYFEFPAVVKENKRAYFEKIVKEGGEGVVLKNLRAPYEDSSSRRRDAWVKVKKRIEFDAFISGFKLGEVGSGWENLVGALEFSVMTDKGPHVLGYATNIPFEQRKAITQTNGVNGPTLDPLWYGKVAQISGQDISARSLRLSHCTLDRWRDGVDGKTKEECRAMMADLRAAAEWVG